MYTKKNKIILWILAILGLMAYCIMTADIYYRNFLIGLLFFIPAIVVWGLLFLKNYFSEKHQHFQKNICIFFNFIIYPFIFIVTPIFMFISFFIISFMYSAGAVPLFAYHAAKNSKNSTYVSHFPQKIPKNAKNKKLYEYITHFGSDGLYLEFEIDKNFIENEVHKYKYKKVYLPNTQNTELDSGTLGISLMNNAISMSACTFHIIDYQGYYSHHWPYSYGIATCGKNKIVYFYSSPDTP